MILEPSNITIMPAAIFIYLMKLPKRKKTEFSKMPSKIKTVLNPKMNPADVHNRSDFGFEFFVELSGKPRPVPARMLKYDGIRGSTHGDKNESNPAAKTIKPESFSVMETVYKIINCQSSGKHLLD